MMKPFALTGIFLLSILHLFGQGDLTVEISGVTILKGEILVSVYNKESSFMKTDQAYGKVKVPANQELVRVKLKSVPAGEYAIAVFQDLNGNELLDVSEMKVPKEPFGFSNNPKGNKGPATYVQARFRMDGELTLRIELVNNFVTPNKDKSEGTK